MRGSESADYTERPHSFTLPKYTRKYCPTVASTVSILSVSLSCCSNMTPDTSDSSLSVMTLSFADASRRELSMCLEAVILTLSRLQSSSMQCLTGCMRKLIMSHRTHLGRSTAGCTILYLMKEIKPKMLLCSHGWGQGCTGISRKILHFCIYHDEGGQAFSYKMSILF